MEDKEVVIRLKNISKTFDLEEKRMTTLGERVRSVFSKRVYRQIKALENVNLEIYKGEFFGVVGHNGSGKSTLLKLILGAFPPDPGGTVEVHGNIIRLALGLGFNGNLSGHDNIYLNASLMGIPFKEIGKRYHDIVAFAELETFINNPVKYYSSGMVSRLAFSIALHVDSDIILMDEFFGGVGDINFREKSEEVFRQRILDGRTIIHVSHGLDTVEKFCDRVLLLHQGKPVLIGKPDEVLSRYHELMATTPVQRG